jgi:hypothetical protein
MPNWVEVLDEISQLKSVGQSALDVVRRKYLKQIHTVTGRNVIAYYSGFLQTPRHPSIAVNDKDLSGFMLNIHGLDRKLGLDLILHTPGGDLTATEAIVDYLHSMFGNDIRAIVPQLSMSAGTMIAFSCSEIIMGKHSSLGPIDPQINGMACQAILAEFDRAQKEITHDPKNAGIWQFIISKYSPTLLGACLHAITMSNKLAGGWLLANMCKGNAANVKTIMDHFSSHDDTQTHARHIPMDKCSKLGVQIIALEDHGNQALQDAVLTTHHAFMHTFQNTGAVKIIENHLGVAYVENLRE